MPATPATAAGESSGLTEVLAPVRGRAVPMQQVPDPTFADGLVGPGAAIDVRRSPGGTVTRVLARPRPVAPLPRPDRAPNRFSVAPRPTVVDDLAATGITRLSRGRWGSRLFTLFFVFVFAVILLQLIDSLLYPLYR